MITALDMGLPLPVCETRCGFSDSELMSYVLLSFLFLAVSLSFSYVISDAQSLSWKFLPSV